MRLKVCRFAAGLICAVVAACGAPGGDIKPRTAGPAANLPTTAPSVITPDLEMMRMLPADDPGRQSEVVYSARQAMDMSPTPSNKLRYALALATPGHPGSDPAAAQRQLADLLSSADGLQAEERLLAIVELRQVDQQLIVLEENKHLREEAPRESRDKLIAANRRLAVESDENARLRKALDEAQAKLDAVTHIERSINDRAAHASRSP